MSQLTKL